MMTRAIFLSFILLTFSFLAVYSQSNHDDARERTELLGGETTIVNTTPNAFGQRAPNLTGENRLFFFVGNSFFNQNWVTAPSSTTARDGLGPLFNARSCASCHFKDGRGRAPEFAGESPTGFLLRIGLKERDIHGNRLPDPHYGLQIQDNAIEGVPVEANFVIEYEEITGEYPDGTPYSLRKPKYVLDALAYGALDAEITMSGRVANQMIGLGLLEAIPESTLQSLADPNDRDRDGISGRYNWVWDRLNQRMAIGRFGWKAEQPSVLQQVSAAFVGDIGITTTLFPTQNCSSVEVACQEAVNGSNQPHEPEIIADDLLKVALYSSSLAVPVQRDFDNPDIIQGQERFMQVGCQGCHVQRLETGIHPTIPALSHQVIYPYTDMLLHDMGAGLADELRDYQAEGSEWRTAPLWGIGLFHTVNHHTNYLHDGRARNIEEAILWHGGEAEASKEGFMALPAGERAKVLRFLESL